ncbi:MAG TPA: TadE/TadG family type IV pilus assembly protein [Thermohalobaculum sp.]|nr:TadE/TadG family type IV pilus assembly protein [Thermohalobaculum sp.]
MGLISAFLRDERGSYTIEFCLWIPMFLFFLAATVDASLLYLTHNNMWNAARDAARRASTGELEDYDAIRNHLEGTLLLGGTRYFLPPGQGIDEANKEVTVAIQTQVGDASLFNIFGWVGWWFGSYSPGEEGYACNNDGNIMGCALHAEVRMALEPQLASGT